MTTWQCGRCGRFVPGTAVHSSEHLDPGAYYGVSSRVWADCPRCGEADNPRPVITGADLCATSNEVVRGTESDLRPVTT